MEDYITINTNVPAFSNPELSKATTTIFKLGDAIKKNLYNVAYIMASVDRSECYKDDGFNNVHEWSMKTFGFKKSASYSLLKIGNEYTQEIKSTDRNGKERITGYGSNLITPEMEKDFTTTQIECMLPLGHDTAVDTVANGNITPEMTCKEIKKIVKSMTNPETESETESETEPEIESEPETEPVEIETTIQFVRNPETLEHWIIIDGKNHPIDSVTIEKIMDMLGQWCISK